MKDNGDRLTDGLDEAQRQALGDLTSLARFLQSDPAPEPSLTEQAHLLAVLEPYLSAAAPCKPSLVSHWLRLAGSQIVLFESSFWLAGVLTLLLGLFLTIVDGQELLPLAFVLLAPLLAAASVAYAFRPETRTLGELERLTATDAAELLYIRLALTLTFNLLVALLLLLLIWLEGAQVVLWRLALAWLGPMLVLSGLALYTTIRWNSLVGAILPLGLWGGLVLLGWREVLLHAAGGITPTAWLLLGISHSNLVLIGSILTSLVGLGLLVQAGRTVTSERRSWS